jgi:hypothetical protein
MNRILILVLILTSFSAFAGETKRILTEYENECSTTQVVVDEIVRDSHIKGHISGLPQDAYEKFKVVFYVKTNRWYVHPYAFYQGQEEGYSYSNIHADGSFWVRTVRRQVPSKKLAVVVVPRSYQIMSQQWWLKPLFGRFGGVIKNQCSHTIVDGNGDFFL